MFAEGLGTHTCMNTEVLAETACRSKIHTESDLFDALVGGEQALFDFANGDIVDNVRRGFLCHLITDIGQIFGRDRHLVGIP